MPGFQVSSLGWDVFFFLAGVSGELGSVLDAETASDLNCEGMTSARCGLMIYAATSCTAANFAHPANKNHTSEFCAQGEHMFKTYKVPVGCSFCLVRQVGAKNIRKCATDACTQLYRGHLMLMRLCRP